jgi:hypothetical protein
MVTNEQLYIAIGIPLLFNASLTGLLFALMNSALNSKLDAFRSEINAKFATLEARMEGRFAAIDARFDAIDQRFDDMRELWRAELHRVEEILDARLKHLESR